MKRFNQAFLFLVLVLNSPAAESNKPAPAIYVAPLTAEDGQIPNWTPAIGKGLAKMVITSLSGSGKYKVVDTSLADDLAQDLKAIVPSNQKNGGRAAAAHPSADLIFHGKVSQFGSKSSGFNVKEIFKLSNLPGGGPKAVNAAIRIDWALVDANSQTVVTNGWAQDSERGFGFDLASSGGGSSKPSSNIWTRLGMAVATNAADQATGAVGVNQDANNISFGNSVFMKSAIGLATCKVVTNIVEALASANLPPMDPARAVVQIESKPAPVKSDAAASAAPSGDAPSKTGPATPADGKVIAVAGKNIIVSLGSKNGLKDGDKLDLYETVDFKDDKGAVVFSDEKRAGEIVLESVQEEKSRGTFAGEAAVKSGWVVKIKPSGKGPLASSGGGKSGDRQ